MTSSDSIRPTALCACISLLLLVGYATSSSSPFLKYASSDGERSFVFNRCLRLCHTANCSRPMQRWRFLPAIFQWSCAEDCHYACMWKAVKAFELDHLPLPRFYGKWPLIRLVWIQEPVSALLATLNVIVSVMTLVYFYLSVSLKAPMFFVWLTTGLLNFISLLSSTLYHIRSTAASQRVCRLSNMAFLLSSLVAFLIRVTVKWRRSTSIPLSVAALSFFIFQVFYRTYEDGETQMLNLYMGIATGIGWLIWAFFNRHKERCHVVFCVNAALMMGSIQLLQLNDTPPLLWTFDSTALRLAFTLFLGKMWYRFVKEDCLYLLRYYSDSNASHD